MHKSFRDLPRFRPHPFQFRHTQTCIMHHCSLSLLGIRCAYTDRWNKGLYNAQYKGRAYRLLALLLQSQLPFCLALSSSLVTCARSSAWLPRNTARHLVYRPYVRVTWKVRWFLLICKTIITIYYCKSRNTATLLSKNGITEAFKEGIRRNV